MFTVFLGELSAGVSIRNSLLYRSPIRVMLIGTPFEINGFVISLDFIYIIDQSGTVNHESNRASKHGAPRLRKTLFQIMSTLLQLAPADDPVYLFMMKKKSEGKPYQVYMTAGANKFLRIYYGKVKECLASQTAE